MRVMHQCGHNTVWNVDSLQDDLVGDGLIISPVNLPSSKIREKIPDDILAMSIFDPQFYRPQDGKSHLSSYEFFPANILSGFATADFLVSAQKVAMECLTFQKNLGVKQLVIPVRFYSNVTDMALQDLSESYVEPFLSAYETLQYDDSLLLTVIASESQLESGHLRDETLSWATRFTEIDGVYLIFDNSFSSKQIKDTEYLFSALTFIRELRDNDLEVHIGYSGLEGILYSVADPTSVAMGAYENLRSFAISRLDSGDTTQGRSPTPRLLSDKLLQSIPVNVTPPLDALYPQWRDLIVDTEYRTFLLDKPTDLHFSKPQIYKHYFSGFTKIVNQLPRLGPERIDHILDIASQAIDYFNEIDSKGIKLDENSDGSHLYSWQNALAMYTANPR